MSFQAEPVVVVRDLDGPIGRVFDAWSKPELLRRWFAAGATTVEEADVDFKSGGAYRIKIVDAEGDYIVFGNYTRIEPPYLLEFTWQWEESSFEKGVSLVTVRLKEKGNQTELTLTHAQLSNQKSVELHVQGWTPVLNRLIQFIVNEEYK